MEYQVLFSLKKVVIGTLKVKRISHTKKKNSKEWDVKFALYKY